MNVSMIIRCVGINGNKGFQLQLNNFSMLLEPYSMDNALHILHSLALNVLLVPSSGME